MTTDGSALTIDHMREGRACVVTLKGRVDSNTSADLLARMRALMVEGERDFVVDLGGVLYLTSAAFRVLLVATDEAEARAGRFVLCGLAGHVRDLFEMGGLLEAFAVRPSREAALSEFA